MASYSAGQEFDKANNRLWIDLHCCSTAYAIELFEMKLSEACRYGVSTIEAIYGTPPRFEGSIQQAVLEICANGHVMLQRYEEIHAGVVVSITANPTPAPRDLDMCFSGFHPEHDDSYWRNRAYREDLYPYREEFSSAQIARIHDVTEELVRDIANNGFHDRRLPDVTCRTAWDEEWRQNRRRWIFTQRDLTTFGGFIEELRAGYYTAIAARNPSADEVRAMMRRTRKVVPSNRLGRHADSLLTKVRKTLEAARSPAVDES